MTLVELAMEYGVKNIRFLVPMSRLQMAGIIPGIAFRSSDAPQDMVECEICEERYKVLDNYKITLKAIDRAYGKDHFYQSDLESMLRSRADYRVFVVTIDGYTMIPNTEFDL